MQYALDSVQYAENIAQLLQCKVNGNPFRYIIMSHMQLAEADVGNSFPSVGANTGSVFLVYHIYLAIRRGSPLSRMTTNY